MKSIPHAASAALVLSCLSAAAPLHAGVTMTTSKSGFLSQLLPDIYTESFDSLPTNTPIASPKSFTSPGNAAYSFSATATTINNQLSPFFNWSASPEDFGGPGKLKPINTGDTVTISFSGSGVYGVGVNLALIDAGWTPIENIPFYISINGGTSSNINSTSNYSFLGFVSDTPITSITFSQINGYVYAISLDNLYVGGIANVPEAATLGVLSLSMLPLLLRKKK